MRTFWLLLLMLLTGPLASMACDICGCGVGNNYIGILPDFNKKIVGLRYRYNSMLTHVGVNGTVTYLTTKEKYNTVELWGGWNITNNIRVMASVPYNINERINQGTSNTKNGIGDITVNGFYQFIHSRKNIFSNKLLVQSLWVGGGIKLPTGKYNPLDKSSSNESANLFQSGTGSFDFSVNAMYDIRLQDAGFNVSSSYKINTANKYHYTYGNKFSSTAQAYYKVRIKNVVTLAPNTGLVYEKAQKDEDNQFSVDISGGKLFLATAGLETTVRKISVGCSWQKPLSQNLANGIIKANNRMMVHLSVIL